MCSTAKSGRRNVRRPPLKTPAILVQAFTVTQPDGSREPLDDDRLARVIDEACEALEGVQAAPVLTETRRNLYDGITLDDLSLAPILAARTLVETDPNYAFVAARLLLDKLRREALGFVFGRPEQATQHEMTKRYADYFAAYVRAGIDAELLDGELARFDLNRISAALKPERDLQFQYLGLQTLYDRYLPADGRHTFRIAASLPHARRHGAQPSRTRSRGARHRVLRCFVLVQFHGLDADAV